MSTASRIEHLSTMHEERFGIKPNAFFSTSGRTELGGNHTDHNLGCVLAGSINLDSIAAVRETSDNIVTIISEGFPEVKVDLSSLEIKKEEFETTAALTRGIAASIVKRGGRIGGFTAYTNSVVAKGSGLSSSACIEVQIGTIFNNLYNNDKFSTTEIAIIGQEAENNYYGKPSGLMDQIACANGGIVGIDFQDPHTPVITPVNVNFEDYGYNLVVVNTGGNHADLTKDYASIPSEMKAVAQSFGKDVMRQVSYEEFMSNIATIRAELNNDRALLRAMHFIKENERAQQMAIALKNKDFISYLSLVSESGNSSFKYLQNIYSPQAPDQQGLSLALALTEDFLHGTGTCRVQGGGFAGTIQAYIPVDKTPEYFAFMEKIFGENSCTKLCIRNTPSSRIS